jgi:hypothetical protein
MSFLREDRKLPWVMWPDDPALDIEDFAWCCNRLRKSPAGEVRFLPDVVVALPVAIPLEVILPTALRSRWRRTAPYRFVELRVRLIVAPR